MKKLLVTGFLTLSAIFVFAQEQLATDDGGLSAAKEPLKLRIRKNVIRPLGKDWYITVSGGYGIPFLSTNKRSPLKEIGDKDWYQKNGELSVKPLFGTNGGGFAMNVGWGHMFNKNIGIDVTHTFAWHPEKLDARIDLDTYYASQKTGTFGIYISPHLIMRWENGKRFGMTGKAGLVLPVFGKTQSRAYILDKQGRIIETLAGYPIIPLAIPGLIGLEIELIAKASTSYHPTVGVSAAIGFDVKLSERVTLFAEARVQAYTVKLKETIFDEFQQTSSINVLGIKIPAPDGLLVIPSNVSSAAEAPKFLTHYVYRDEITEESNTARYGFKEIVNLNPNIPEVDINQPMEEPGQKFNASTLYFNAGLRIDFDLWDKKREAKRESTSAKKAKNR
jgi:opacity protein-like surface antigen